MTPDDAPERARIVAAAYRLLIDSNGSSVPITDILDEAGLSTRAFYRHFDTKDALLLAMFRNDSDHVLEQLNKVAATADNARDALQGWIDHMLRLTADPRRRERVLVLSSGEVTRAKGFHTEQAHYRASQDEAIARLLRRGIIDGSLPRADPEHDAGYIRAAIHTAFEELMSWPVGNTVDDVVRGLVGFALRALENVDHESRETVTASDPRS